MPAPAARAGAVCLLEVAPGDPTVGCGPTQTEATVAAQQKGRGDRPFCCAAVPPVAGSLIRKRRAWIERQSLVKILVDISRLAIRGGVEDRLNGPVLCRRGSSKL